MSMAASSSAGPSTFAGQPPTTDKTLEAELATRLQCRIAGTDELLGTYQSAKQLIDCASRADLVGLLRGKDPTALGPSLRAFGRRRDLPDWVEVDVTHFIAATVARSQSKQKQQRALAPTQRPRQANRQQSGHDVELEQPALVSDVELQHPFQTEDCKFVAPPPGDHCELELPRGVTQDHGVFLEVPATRVQGGRKHCRTIKCPDKLVGQAKVWRLEQRGIQSSPEVGKVVGNCVEILSGLVIAGRRQRRAMGPELAAVRTRDLLEELLRRLPAETTPRGRQVALSARVAGALCGIGARRAKRHHTTYLRGTCDVSTSAGGSPACTAPSAPSTIAGLEHAQLRIGRAVLAAAVEGRSRASALREMHRMRIAGCEVGRSLRSEKFIEFSSSAWRR